MKLAKTSLQNFVCVYGFKHTVYSATKYYYFESSVRFDRHVVCRLWSSVNEAEFGSSSGL